ncbi:hypothetical protein [Leptolyngbya ohadii]|uniref:hypothetical protein n=1 Tax=Leptolyngbya ohadii TaxID=1962290 RepID=UPI000B59FA35|nr:hypothetical protein [Leptolyngbya ohadii]
MSQSPLQPVSSTPAEEQSVQPNAEAATAQTALLESPELASPFTQGADRLMDDLFGELEQALARESVLPNSPEPAEWIAPPAEMSAAMPTSPIADPVGMGALMPRLTPRQLVPGEVEPDPDVMLAVNPSIQTAPKSRSFDKLLLATFFASLLTTGLLWLWFRDGSRFPRLENPLENPQPSPVAQTPPLTPAQIEAAQQQQFLTYVDRSLDRIEQSTQENRLAQQNQPDQPAATPSQTVLERVYVPVYQPPQVIAAQPNVVIQQPAVSGSAPGNSPAAPAPAPATNVPNIAAASSYKLVGVLELGDRSAALFEVNGNPRRIQVGEPIGDSGWTLVSVANQEALVRRNGEVRSIYVGQQF